MRYLLGGEGAAEQRMRTGGRLGEGRLADSEIRVLEVRRLARKAAISCSERGPGDKITQKKSKGASKKTRSIFVLFIGELTKIQLVLNINRFLNQ